MDTVTVVCFWVAQVLGSLLGFLFFAMAGMGKLVPVHPMYAMMKPGFADKMGPFFGLNGDLLRTIIGLAEVAAGLGYLVGLWGSFFGLIEGDLLDLCDALLICAPLGMVVIMLCGGWFHIAVEGKPGPPGPLTVMNLVILGARLKVTPFAELSDKMVVIVFGIVAVVGVALAVVLRLALGTTPKPDANPPQE
eukprot:gnl/TRDRNA2_/TRDRNA2_139486_c0_seq2.p1 gnl/TRDRNA2_/TRDRNA2_139486_c0~~gnl/TRDRNA2_/TRDRNA2_139486_c0_seq2.p1  ORF type:complete len:192 (+),score=25.08 gnl/TRDRNA2_/TRDRNA2_139486_c0_seq2:68-643(+)